MANPSSQGDQTPPTQVPPPPISILPTSDQSPRSTSSSPSPMPVRSPGIGSSGQPFSKRHPIYRGIRIRSGKWVSEIREPRKSTRIWLGTYPSPEMAAAAYDVAAIALKGPDTPLNFPESMLSYPIPVDTSASNIRAAAATAAAARLPKTERATSSDVGRAETEATISSETAGVETASIDVGGANPEATTSGETVGVEPSGQEYIDEEMLLNMPNLLVEMAGAMMVSPPRINTQSSDDSPGSSDAENLWSYQ